MKKTQKAILMAALMIASTTSVAFAATGETTTETTATAEFAFTAAPTSSEVTANSAKISWEAVVGSTGYMIHYGKVSAKADGKYENDSDLIDATETGATLEKLEAKTTYYISVSAYDKDANESPLSEEITVTTTEAGAEATSTDMNAAKTALSVKSVNVTATNKLEVVFSAELDNSSEAKREFKLASKDGAEIAISSVELTDTNKLALTLSTPLDTSKEYSLTVLALQDKAGNNVEAGVDGQFAFTTPETIEALDAATASGNAAEVATDAKALPATGPEQFLIFALAMIL
jgi:hypothetical protein